jgi:hypothetical protein
MSDEWSVMSDEEFVIMKLWKEHVLVRSVHSENIRE